MKDRRKSVPAGSYGTLLHAPCLALRTLFPSPHHPQQHPHDSPNAGRCTTFFLLHAEAIFPAFRITPPAGGAPKSGRMLQKKYSNPGGNSAQAGNRQAVSSGRKFHPAGKPPEQDRRKSPLKKYGRREKSSHEWPVHSPFTFAAGTFQAERNVRNKCLPEKDSPQEKSLLRNMPLHRRLQRKKISTAHTFCRKREEDEGAQERTAEYRWRKPFFDRRAEKLPEARTRLREKTGYGKGS